MIFHQIRFFLHEFNLNMIMISNKFCVCLFKLWPAQIHVYNCFFYYLFSVSLVSEWSVLYTFVFYIEMFLMFSFPGQSFGHFWGRISMGTIPLSMFCSWIYKYTYANKSSQGTSKKWSIYRIVRSFAEKYQM